MADDYKSTASEMYRAGSALVSAQPRTACYLLGYVAECVMKAVLVQARVESGWTPEQAYANVKSASHRYSGICMLASATGVQPSVRLTAHGDPFAMAPMMSAQVVGTGGHLQDHRDPIHRYDGARWDAVAASTYQNEATALITLMQNLMLDGAL